MDGRFKNLIIGIILFFIIALITLGLNWYWIKNDTPLQSLIFGFLFSFAGAIVGGFAGGYGSYLGGINGAKQSITLLSDKEREQAKRQLMSQLKYTTMLFSKDTAYIIHGTLIYDNDWPRYLGLIPEFSDDEIKHISLWFSTLRMLDHELGLRNENSYAKQVSAAAPQVNLILSHIVAIIEKHKDLPR